MMNKKIILIMIIMFMFPLIARAVDPPTNGSTLDLQQCIAIALDKHPSLKASKGMIKASESIVGQAKAGYYPQINWITSYQRNSSTVASDGSINPLNQYSTSVNLGITLLDFGKTSDQVKIQELNVKASHADFDDVTVQIIFNVKSAYYNFLQADRNRGVAADTMSQFQQHLDEANTFFRIGTKPKFDVTKAEVDLGNARLNALTAENALHIARVILKDAMGIPESADFAIIDNLAFRKSDLQLDDVLKSAYLNQPGLRSIIAKREAMEHSIDLARKGYFPILSGNAGYGYSGKDFPLDKGWNAGVMVSYPIFTGLLTKFQVDEAKANLEVITANEEILRQGIRVEIQQAYLNVQDAGEQIAIAEMTVSQARENYELAAGRYRAGVGSPIEIADATIALNNARAVLNTALFNHKIAQALLEKSMGSKP